MNRSHAEAARRVSRLRIALVLLALAALLALGGCATRHNGASNMPVQTTGQQTGGQPTTSGQSNGSNGSNGSNNAAQQIQSADQQVQDAMQSVDNAQNDANSADNQSDPTNDVP